MLNSTLGRIQVANVQYGTAQKQFNVSDAVNFVYPVPPLAEQNAIASALSDADGLIESLEKLIAKKRQIKHGTMQELLIGNRRLPGFTGEWETKRLGELISSVEYGSSAKSAPNGAVPVLRMGNLQGGKIDWKDLVYTDNEEEIAKYTLRSEDVLFNRTNTIDLVGKTSIYLGEQPAIFAGYLIRVNVIENVLDSRYLNYILNTESAKKYSSMVLSVAVGQANINGQKLKTYPIPIPPTFEEQTAIATILTDLDAEIAAIEAKLAKARQLKQGMMEELLTGRIRLV
ncbi:restriction endonuclease subunit S [Planctomicrobium sp. SH527]|uniref:restriction endonuclease subunit S n=1 Tax=Planctomicrobium sp. SH527 TaxID=3448123 RepID=UPI003F5B2287